MQIINEPKLDFKDVLILPKVSYISSRAEVYLSREFTWIGLDGNEYKWDGLPIIASNMDGVGTFAMAKSLSLFTSLTALTKTNSTNLARWESLASAEREGAIYTIGVPSYPFRRDALKQLDAHFTKFPDARFLCIDVANGYNMELIEWVRAVREYLPPYVFIIAGNVVTAPQTEQLILAGANAVKVGIGSGSVCTTRKVTGVGYPQLSAIVECADAAHGLHGFVISDGGCQVPGDVCKAFAAGADFVMLGGMLAGHDESEATIEIKTKNVPDNSNTPPITKIVKFHGMSSKSAQNIHNGGLADYRSSEGKEVEIDYRGPVEHTMNHISGGLRSCCAYVGAAKLKDLSKRATFIRVYNGHQYNTVFGDSNEVS